MRILEAVICISLYGAAVVLSAIGVCFCLVADIMIDIGEWLEEELE